MPLIDWSKKITPRDRQRTERAAAREDAKLVLRDTDWYVLRALETGKPVPPAIAQKRNKARTDAEEGVE